MSDLKYTVEVTGLKDVEQLEKNLDRLHNTLNAGRGSGKSLEEMRKILVGMRGQSSVISDLRDSIKGLNTATDQLSKNFDSGFKQLDRTFKQGFQLVLDRVNMFGAEYGNALGTQLTKGMESAGQKAKTSGEKLAGELKNIRKKLADSSTAQYEGMVSGNPLQKLNEKTAKELVELQAHGARLSSFHKTTVDEYKKYGTLYTQEMSALDTAKQRTRDKELNLERSFNAELNKVYAQRANIAAKAAVGSTTMQGSRFATNISMTGDSSSMLNYASSVDKARDAQDKLRASGKPLQDSFKGLAVHGNDVHSAMRGLASGFNLLWLTWGNLAPLFAGAAISNGFMQTAKQGMEVAHTLEVVATLGENSTESMKDLTSELIRLGQNGPRGPLEIAEAFKTLSLAGLDANKILAVTGTVLNFSTSGTTSLQTAADVLVSVTTAFGTGAAGFERSADIITRAAADSKASVESFGEAMKTASVAGEQYGAKQEDVALLIQLLAQVGIQGSAAGTSVRNMYADITGRSGQVGKILKSLKLDFKDLDGNVVSTVEQMRMLDEVLKQYDSKSQGNIIQAIYGERGAKAAIAALQAYRTAAQDSSKYANKLEEDFAKVANAAADSAIAAARLGQTSQKAFETAGAAMRTTMFEAFREIEPQLYMTAVAFQEAFGSAETRELLKSMTSAVATLGMAVAKNLEPIAKVAILWAEYRLALFAVNNVLAASATLKQSYATVTKALTAATVADTTATALNNAAKASPALAGAAAGRTLYTANVTASTGAVIADTTATANNTRAKQANQIATAGIGMTVLKALPVVGNAIALASVAWMVFKSATDDAGNAVENYAQTKADKIAEKLEQEAEHLRRVNEERLKGIGLMEAEARVRESYDREASVSDLTTKEDKLRAQLNNLNVLRENLETSARKNDQGMLDAIVSKVQATETELSAAMLSRAAAEDRFDRAAAERRKRTKESNDIAVKEAADQAKQLKDTLEKGVGGLKTWSLTDFQGGGGAGGAGGNNFVDLNRDKELQALKAHYDAELAVANDYYNKSKQLLDGHRSANLISEEEYMVQSLQLSRSHEAEQLQVLEASLTAYTEASERRKAALESQMSGAKGKGKNMLLDQLKRETQEFEIFVTNYEKERAKVAAESYARVGETVLKLQTEVGKLLKSSEDFWDNAAVSSAAQKDADELAKKYKNMNTSILSMDSAMFEFEKAQKSTQSEVKKMNAALEKQLSIQKNLLQIELLSLKAAQASGRLTLDEAIQRATLITQFKEGIAELEGQIADNTEKGLELGAERGWDAFQKMREKQVEELANSMSEAVVDGLMSGDYKSIGKNIRDILQRELLREPLTAIINGVMNGIVGGISDAIFGGGGGSGGGILGMASNGMSLYNTYQNAPGYINKITSFLGLGGGNAGLGLSAATAGGAMWGGTAAGTGLGLSAGGTGLGMAAPTAGFWAPGTVSVLPGAGAAGATGSSGLMAGLQTAGPWIAGAVALAAAFGAFRKTKVVDTGIMGTLGVEGGIHDFVQKRKDGSLLSGPKYSIEDHGVSTFDKPMQDAFSAMRTAAIDMGKILGLATDHLKDFTTVITLDSANSSTGTRGLNLKGLSDEEVQAKVQQALEQANNEMAQQLIGTWTTNPMVEEAKKLMERSRQFGPIEVLDTGNGTYANKEQEKLYDDVREFFSKYNIQASIRNPLLKVRQIAKGKGNVYTPSEFAREGETAIETLTRLAQSLSTVNGTLDLLGLKLYEGSLAGGDLASKLVDLFGGLEAFTSVTSGYYQNFYSEEERFRKAGETVNEALKSIGVELDVFGGEASKVQYRELVEKAFAEGNQELAAQLLQMSAAFSEVANAAEQATRSLNESLVAIMKRFSDGAIEARDLQAQMLAEDASKIWKDVPVDILKQIILSASSLDVEGYLRDAWPHMQTTEAQQALVSFGNALLDFTSSAGDASGAMSGLTDTITRELTAAYNAMQNASSVLEKIQSAMGIVTSSLNREAQLWQALGKADYRTQIEIASELSDLVIKRHQVEQQNAKKLLDFGKSLQAYVNSLKIGNLSTFTPAEKLAEAGKQYTDTLKKAQTGDEDALRAIQGASSSYLDLARQYYASSDDYTRIFESVTNSLESLGVKSQSEAQMQLEVSSNSLNELKKLEAIVQQAYNTASTDFSVQKDLLQQQIDQMLRTADGIEKVQALLAGLPYDISSQFNVGSASTPASGAGASSYEALARKYVSIVAPHGGPSDVNYAKQYAANISQGQLDDVLKESLALLSDPGDRQDLLAVFKNLAQLRGLTINGSHANGLSYVPYDGYVAQLHEGERVLTAKENSKYASNGAARSTEMSIMAAEIRTLNAKLDKLTEQNERLMSAQIRATVESSNTNSERVVEGITKATERASYAATIEKGYK